MFWHIQYTLEVVVVLSVAKTKPKCVSTVYDYMFVLSSVHLVPVWAEQMKLIMREGNRRCKIYRQEITGNFSNNNTQTLTCTHTSNIIAAHPISFLRHSSLGQSDIGIDLFFLAAVMFQRVFYLTVNYKLLVKTISK